MRQELGDFLQYLPPNIRVIAQLRSWSDALTFAMEYGKAVCVYLFMQLFRESDPFTGPVCPRGWVEV